MMTDFLGQTPVAGLAPGRLAEPELVDAVLGGGPRDMPADFRMYRVSVDEAKIKVPYLGGYEHFERVDPSDNGGPVHFEWSGRTRIAE
jgi:hypothetical protein